MYLISSRAGRSWSNFPTAFFVPPDRHMRRRTDHFEPCTLLATSTPFTSNVPVTLTATSSPSGPVQVEFRPRVDCERIDSESLARGIQGLHSAEHLRAAHRYLVIHGGALEALGRLAGACQIVDIRRRDIGDAT
jgi:hypothetical protein